ncbi:hypothetical protein SAMN04489726_2463 [Allokutzneria albata]|uniref:Uncharacterized protein n=2 Tax=Allokutzneria albata TaxID=211114 RepID=A0A1G9UK79_ALLAB|nr:hypothetical protein SAMN04489726_2463 [Allokutzneria albata]
MAASSKWDSALRVGTLLQAHEAVRRLRPAPGARPAIWREYFQRCAEVYEHLAAIDHDHYHEALYWAGRERQKAEEIELPKQRNRRSA